MYLCIHIIVQQQQGHILSALKMPLPNFYASLQPNRPFTNIRNYNSNIMGIVS